MVYFEGFVLSFYSQTLIRINILEREKMDYYLYPPHFIVEPQTNFGDAWADFADGFYAWNIIL